MTMYSHYSYSHGQQQQNMSAGVAVQQGSMTWNGSEWVKDPSSAPTAGGYAYQHPSHVNMASNQQFQGASSVMQPQPQQGESQFERYKRYWAYWVEQAKSQRAMAESLPVCPEKEEALRVAAWADYYANQSASAMQYYQNYTAPAGSKPQPQPQPQPQQGLHFTSVSQPQPQPQPQPHQNSVNVAAPVGVGTTNNMRVNVAASVDGSSSNTTSTITSTNTSARPIGTHGAIRTPSLKRTPNNNKTQDEYPPSLKKYMRLVFSKCKTNKQQQEAQTFVEKEVQAAIENNSVFTTDWSSKPLPDFVENKPSTFNSSSSSSYSSTSLSYSQPFSKTSPSSNSKKKSNSKFSTNRKPFAEEEDYVQLMPVNDSYYGHSTSDVNAKSNAKHAQSSPSQQNRPPIKKKKTDSQQPPNNSKKQKAQQMQQVSAKKKNAFNNETHDGFERSSTALARRANRFSTDTGFTSTSPSASNEKKYMGISVIGGTNGKKKNDNDFEKMTVKGTCQKLEKEYLRLTQPPKAEAVRPQPVLEKHVRNLKRRWVNGKCEYRWLCSQLKAIRQDLTVQRINNEFAVEVYETHARIALEQEDLNEYNQCQTQIKELYDLLEKEGHSSDKSKGLQNQNEFIAYRIIYYVFLTGNKKYDGGSSDLFKIMLSLTPDQRKDPCIAHALKVRTSVAENDYYTFFRLFESCPKMGAYLMDFMVPAIRMSALQRICKAYRPDISVKYVLSELGFNVENQKEFEDVGIKWLKTAGAIIQGNLIITKDSNIQSSVTESKNSLI